MVNIKKTIGGFLCQEVISTYIDKYAHQINSKPIVGKIFQQSSENYCKIYNYDV